MKSLDKLRNASDIAKTIDGGETVSDLIKEFLIDNEPTKKNGLSVKDFILKDKDELHKTPILGYMFYDDTNRIATATDGIKLFINPDEYVEHNEPEFRKSYSRRGYDYEGVICDVYGKPHEGMFPSIYSVLPKDTIPVKIREDLEKAVKIAKVVCKQNRYSPDKVSVCVCLEDDIWMSVSHCELIIRSGIENWETNGYKNQLYTHSENGMKILIMGMLCNGEREFDDKVNMICYNK